MEPNTHTVYWGPENSVDAEVRLPPGMAVTPFVDEVSGVSPVHVDGDRLPHPPEWEHFGDQLLPDTFSTYQEENEKRLTKDDIALHVAVGLTESFVHELMEWLAVDGQRAFDPHPKVDGKSDQHWGVVAEHLNKMFEDLLERYPDPGWSGQDRPLDEDAPVK